MIRAAAHVPALSQHLPFQAGKTVESKSLDFAADSEKKNKGVFGDTAVCPATSIEERTKAWLPKNSRIGPETHRGTGQLG